MLKTLKARVISMIQNKIGLPKDVQDLLDYMVEVGKEQDCVIYQGGQYPIELMSANGNRLGKPLIFRTNEERAAFGAGIHHGVKLMGGSSGFIGNEDAELEFDEMDSKSTHRLPHRRS